MQHSSLPLSLQSARRACISRFLKVLPCSGVCCTWADSYRRQSRPCPCTDLERTAGGETQGTQPKTPLCPQLGSFSPFLCSFFLGLKFSGPTRKDFGKAIFILPLELTPCRSLRLDAQLPCHPPGTLQTRRFVLRPRSCKQDLSS